MLENLIKRRIREDDILRFLVEGPVSETGTEFFRALARNLSEALQTCGAWVTDYLPESRRLRALAFWISDRFLDHFEYAIDGTACQSVIETKSRAHFPERLLDFFPNDADAADQRAARSFPRIKSGVPCSSKVSSRSYGRERMGISFSTVGNFGSGERMDYTVIGKQVNLANRLQAAAQAGEILIGQETWLLVRDVFRCVAKKPVQAKGFERPIQTYAVMGPELAEDPAIIEEARPVFRLTLNPAQVEASERLAVIEKLRAAIARLG